MGRDPNSGVKLLAAAKSQSVEAISAAIAGGVALIGENYVQEAQDKKNPTQRAGGMAYDRSLAAQQSQAVPCNYSI